MTQGMNRASLSPVSLAQPSMADPVAGVQPTTLLLAATRPEILPTVDRLNLRWRDRRHAIGTAGGRRIVAMVTGIGVKRALGALEEARGEHALTNVINLGFAGGLAPSWQGGDVASIARVMNENGDVIELDPAGEATLLTLDRMVADVSEKRRLHEAHGADMVDMETHAIAKRLAEMRTDAGEPIAFVALRAVSDPADVALPPEMVRWVDDAGRPRATAAMAWLARNPLRLPLLTRLQRDTRRASEALAKAVAERLEPPA